MRAETMPVVENYILTFYVEKCKLKKKPISTAKFWEEAFNHPPVPICVSFFYGKVKVYKINECNEDIG